ncbi:DNA-directed RNA polymerase subunit [Rhynchospora pubera]|uniref:DNA-directed RNA polymerase subunit n=1 Tax=Rhynchospora pubera TaxID=906938 RepID=A0AAV8CUA2_9POAL|nr:DNA-directed RNA polymerase subunit [Rhynchospora pubera]
MAGARASEDMVESDSVDSVHFTFYRAEELRRISVKKITRPDLVDAKNLPVPDGLFDPAMGPINKNDSCRTCGLLSTDCPGHFGHIELARVVYNPLLFGSLRALLQIICLQCHKFQTGSELVERYTSQLELITKGDIVGARDLEEKTSQKSFLPEGEDESTCDFSDESSLNFEIAKKSTWTSIQYAETLSIISRLLKKREKTCNHCGYRNPRISSPVFGWLNKVIRGSDTRANIITSTDISEQSAHSEVDYESDGGKKIASLPDEKRREELRGGQQHLLPSEVEGILKDLWENEPRFCHLICDLQQSTLSIAERETGYEMFFLKVVLVPPNQFRPSAGSPDSDRGILEHPHNKLLSRVVGDNIAFRSQLAANANSLEIVKSWMNLQRRINLLFDSSKATSRADKEINGIRQLLEKKSGIIRQNMMGKRVNYACRSVISPDPFLAVNEIGIPPDFAKKLTYPERVTAWNVKELQLAVLNGSEIHAGATEFREGGVIRKLTESFTNRYSVFKKLPSSRADAKLGKGLEADYDTKVVYRHLKDGDIVLVNRQPTLHKSSMMAHVVRVLKEQKTIRMHYANCSTYNADFDGDEMNVHLPQDEISRAEAMNIVNANRQYNVSTSGDPIRGLIQDHIVSAVLLTNLDTFLTREEYDQLLYGSVLPNYARNTLLGKPRCHKISVINSSYKIQPLPPAILKPKPLWTGKQVITTVLNYITRGRPPFTIELKGKIPKEYIQDNKGEKPPRKNTSRGEPPEVTLYIHDNELLKGMIDKAQFGKFGIVHTVHELYGADAAGDLLSVFSRLFTMFLQMHGFTCGVADLIIDQESDLERKRILEKCEERSEDVHARFTGVEKRNADPLVLQREVETVLRRNGDSATATLDRMMCNALNALTSEVNKTLFPNGLQKPFPNNCLSLMASTGAKGSLVNMSQISSLLGQQELEGKRVPRMVSGKTLPCFPPWDTSSRSGGFISDRFLTGLRPQEYYFHCMAGRDGLVDTAVKTSRSGYLQRCLIKNLESLKVSYDYTVRDVDGSVIQFQYGEDGVDVHKTSFLSEFRILSDNRKAVLDKFGDHAKSSELSRSNDYIRDLPCSMSDQVNRFVKLPKEEQKCRRKIKHKELLNLMRVKYLTSLANPGESVGVLAAQSIGEPATQMTLNTFHLAGRGDMNVTLGIPRLQEILMTASKEIRTPVMKCPLLPDTSREEAERVAAKLRRICVADVVERMEVCTIPFFVKDKRVFTVYKLKMQLFPPELYPPQSDLTPDECLSVISDVFVEAMEDAIQKHLSLLNRIRNINEAEGGKDIEDRGADSEAEEEGTNGKSGEDGEMDDGDVSDGEGADAEKRRRQGRDEMEYEDDLEIKAPEKREEIVGDYEDGTDNEVGEVEEDYTMETVETEAEEEVVEDNEEKETREVKKNDKKDKKKKQDRKENDEKMVKEKKKTKKKKRRIHMESNGLDFEVHFRFGQDDPHVLLSEIAQRTAKSIYVRSCKNIERCAVADPETKDGPPTLQTAGVNFDAFWDLEEYIDINRLTTNNIHQMLTTYGVEAARATILQEVSSVFNAYGIGVNKRHLTLIADFMTFDGGYRSMNRIGMGEYNTSPFGKMTFETATKFIVGSAFHGDIDRMESPSASVCLGQQIKMGTGVFDLFQKLTTGTSSV